MVAVGLAGATGCGDRADDKPAPATTTTQEAAVSADPTPTEPDPTPTERTPVTTRIGKIGYNEPEGFAYTVTGTRCGVQRSRSPMNERHDPVYPRVGFTFCIVKFRLYSRSKTPLLFHPLDATAVRLVNKDGTEYAPNPDSRLPLGAGDEFTPDAAEQRALWNQSIPAGAFRSAQLWYSLHEKDLRNSVLQFRTPGFDDGGVDVQLSG